jgi:N-formylglutamate deformylase
MTANPQPDEIFTLHRGTRPLLVSVPHVGTVLPDWLRPRLVDRAATVEDTDWFLDRLYAFVVDLGASLLVPRHSRYVVDLNRPRDNQPMYAGSNNTELCPTHLFTGEALYHPGQAPTDAEVKDRVVRYWQPYHDALAGELGRLKSAHGHAVLFDGHSIKSELPWLFEGSLPHMNLGTVGGSSCAPGLSEQVVAVFARQSAYSHVLDGRFKGGYITRQYGRPADGIHAVQLEMCWRAYMDEAPPYRWDDHRAAAVTPLLRNMIEAMLHWTP